MDWEWVKFSLPEKTEVRDVCEEMRRVLLPIVNRFGGLSHVEFFETEDGRRIFNSGDGYKFGVRKRAA